MLSVQNEFPNATFSVVEERWQCHTINNLLFWVANVQIFSCRTVHALIMAYGVQWEETCNIGINFSWACSNVQDCFNCPDIQGLPKLTLKPAKVDDANLWLEVPSWAEMGEARRQPRQPTGQPAPKAESWKGASAHPALQPSHPSSHPPTLPPIQPSNPPLPPVTPYGNRLDKPSRPRQGIIHRNYCPCGKW